METIPVRTGEQFDLEKVEAFLRERIESLPDEPLSVEQFQAGQSNLTYLLKCGDWKAVLRRPPLGPVAPKAHDMERESRILSRISEVFPFAPKPYLFCDDASVIGGPFFVMERKLGLVVDQKLPSEFAFSPDAARKLSEAAVDTLVQLHSIDYEKAGLASFGYPEGYLGRQVTGWISRYERSKTDHIEEVEFISKWMVDHLPKSGPATIVHNDFKLNNMLFSPKDPSCVTAVLDWEMSTIGDPLADLSTAVSYWNEPGDPEGFTSVTSRPGFFSRSEFVELYAKKSGRDVRNIDYYLVFSFFKIGVISQQIYYRWKKGQTSDPRFGRLGQVTQMFMHKAAQIAEQTAGTN